MVMMLCSLASHTAAIRATAVRRPSAGDADQPPTKMSRVCPLACYCYPCGVLSRASRTRYSSPRKPSPSFGWWPSPINPAIQRGSMGQRRGLGDSGRLYTVLVLTTSCCGRGLSRPPWTSDRPRTASPCRLRRVRLRAVSCYVHATDASLTICICILLALADPM